MFKLLEYFGRIQAVRGRMLGLPAWARFLVFVAAIPGILLLSLSILAVLVSILALLLLTVPLYRVLNALIGPGGVTTATTGQQPTSESAAADFFTGGVAASPGRKKVDVTIID